jgi:hypothetical protein
MPGKIVTLAMFHDPMAAEMTRNRLAAEGIPAMISGDNAGALFGGMGGAFGMVHLQIAEENLERATRLLDAWEGQDEEEDGDPEDSTAISNKKRSKRKRKRRKSDADAREGSASPVPETGIASKPMPPPVQEDRDNDDDDLPSFRVGLDDTASRAWKASIIGLILMPFHLGVFLAVPVLLYAMVLLFRLMGTSEDLSPRGTRSLYVALIASMAAWAVFFLVVFGFRMF